MIGGDFWKHGPERLEQIDNSVVRLVEPAFFVVAVVAILGRDEVQQEAFGLFEPEHSAVVEELATVCGVISSDYGIDGHFKFSHQTSTIVFVVAL